MDRSRRSCDSGEGVSVVKFAVVLVEGLDDLPVAELDGQTPLERAVTPGMDSLAAEGVVGRLNLLRRVAGTGTETALFSLLGGNPEKEIPGLGAFEAFATALPPGGRGRVAAARFVSRYYGQIIDLEGGSIRDQEARLLVEAMNEALGAPGFELVHITGNQCLLLLGEEGGELPLCTAPEFCVGKPLADHLPRGPGGHRLSALVQASEEILDANEVNQVRCDLKENPANLLWVWGVGDVPINNRFLEAKNRKGAMVTRDIWAAGMAMALGLDPVGQVRGVVVDLDALGREAALATEGFEFVVAHCSGPARAGLQMDPREKVRRIEEVDRRVVVPLRDRLDREQDRLAVISGYRVSSMRGEVQAGNNPFVLWGKGAEGGLPGRIFTESESQSSRLEVASGGQFREFFFSTR